MPHRRRNKSKEDGTSGVNAGPRNESTKKNIPNSDDATRLPQASASSRKNTPSSTSPEERLDSHSLREENAAAAESDTKRSTTPPSSLPKLLSVETLKLESASLEDGFASLSTWSPTELWKDIGHFHAEATRSHDLGATGRSLDVVEETETLASQESDWPLSPQDSKTQSESESESHVICCIPNADCFVGKPLHLPNDYSVGVKVKCNNVHCTQSGFMHRVCFDAWEQQILSYLKTVGRARSWSDKQRQQNLWTKKGYDLAYRACDCRCGKGHLRKDLDTGSSSATGKKKNRRRRKSQPQDRVQIAAAPQAKERTASGDIVDHVISTTVGMAGARNQSLMHKPVNGQGMHGVGPNQGLMPNQPANYCLQGILENSGMPMPNIEINHRTSFHRMRTMSQSSSGVGSCSPPNATPNNTPTTTTVNLCASGGNQTLFHPSQMANKMNSIMQTHQSPPDMQGMPTKQLPIGSPPQLNNGGGGNGGGNGGAVPRRRINSNPFATNSRPTTLMSQSWTPNSMLGVNPNQLYPQQPQQQQNSPSSLAPAAMTPTKGASGDAFGNPTAGKGGAVPPEPKICPATGNMFQRRKDLSVFHTLPYPKRNPYHIKIDDEGPHGNDDMRNLILASLSIPKVVRVPCCLCGLNLVIYDRFPLIDGTFYLSPVQHRRDYVPISHSNNNSGDFGGKTSFYLTAVCMSCLEGDNEVRCKSCSRRWDGSWHVLGTMYAFDIFAAVPCCPPRSSCNKCGKPILADPGAKTKLHFFSDFSRRLDCPHCGANDTHFVKSPQSYQVVRKN